jgi:hypothetical protein
MTNPFNFRLTPARVRVMRVVARVLGWLLLGVSLPFRAVELLCGWVYEGFDRSIGFCASLMEVCRRWLEKNAK